MDLKKCGSGDKYAAGQIRILGLETVWLLSLSLALLLLWLYISIFWIANGILCVNSWTDGIYHEQLKSFQITVKKITFLGCYKINDVKKRFQKLQILAFQVKMISNRICENRPTELRRRIQFFDVIQIRFFDSDRPDLDLPKARIRILSRIQIRFSNILII